MSGFLKWAKRLIPKGKFARSVGVLAGGTAFGQVLLLLTLPILTRLYTPEDFGLYGVYMAMIGIGLVVFGLRYEQAIPLAATKEEAGSLFLLTGFLGLTFSLILFFVVFKLPIDSYLGINNDIIYATSLVLGLFSAGIYQSSLFWGLRAQRYRDLSIAKILQVGGQVFLQLLGGYVYFGMYGLLLGDAFGRILAAIYLLVKEPLPWRAIFNEPNRLLQVAKSFSSFPKLYLWSSLANILSLQAFPLLLPAIFGAKSAGQYFLAYRIVASPIQLFSSSGSRVLFSEGARSLAEAREYAIQISRSFLRVGLPVYLGASAIAPYWFPLILGSNWREAGLYAMLLSIMASFWSVAGALSPLLILGRRFEEAFFYTILELVAKLLSLWLGYRLASLLLTVELYSVSAIIISLASVRRFLSVVDISINSWLKLFLLKPLAVSAIFALTIYTLSFVHPLVALFFWFFGTAVLLSKEVRR